MLAASCQTPQTARRWRKGRALILADPVDVQVLFAWLDTCWSQALLVPLKTASAMQILRAVSPATGPALTAVRNDPLLSTTLAATVGLRRVCLISCCPDCCNCMQRQMKANLLRSTPFGELSERVLPGVKYPTFMLSVLAYYEHARACAQA